MTTIYLKPHKEESLKRFHPWVFSGAIAKVVLDASHQASTPEEGELVCVRSSANECLGVGHWQVGSIAVRILAFGEEALPARFWNERLRAAYQVREAIGLIREPNPDPSLKGREMGSVWAKVLSMGAVGSATMTAVIIVAGLAAMMIGDRLSVIGDSRFSYFIGLAVLMVLLGLALYLSPRLLSRWAVVSHKLVAISLGQSLLRLVCWCVQLALVLWALGAVTGYGLPVIAKTFVYYLLVTVTPNVPIAEVGVRGTWAIAVFGSMNAAFAGVLLWVINTLLPCISWFFIRKKYKNKNIDKPF